MFKKLGYSLDSLGRLYDTTGFRRAIIICFKIKTGPQQVMIYSYKGEDFPLMGNDSGCLPIGYIFDCLRVLIRRILLRLTLLAINANDLLAQRKLPGVSTREVILSDPLVRTELRNNLSTAQREVYIGSIVKQAGNIYYKPSL